MDPLTAPCLIHKCTLLNFIALLEYWGVNRDLICHDLHEEFGKTTAALQKVIFKQNHLSFHKEPGICVLFYNPANAQVFVYCSAEFSVVSN